ncbi:MAG: hypothetical protein ACK2UQ_07780, partial [Anaerolineae bacterium]
RHLTSHPAGRACGVLERRVLSRQKIPALPGIASPYTEIDPILPELSLDSGSIWPYPASCL